MTLKCAGFIYLWWTLAPPLKCESGAFQNKSGIFHSHLMCDGPTQLPDEQGSHFASPSEQAYSFLLRPLLRGSSGQRASAKQALFIYRQEPRQCVDSSNVHEKRHWGGARGSLPKGKWDSPLLSSPPSSSQMSWPQGQCWTSGSKSFLGVVGPWARRNMGPWWPHSSSLGSPASYLRNSSLSLSPFLWASLFFTCNLHAVAHFLESINRNMWESLAEVKWNINERMFLLVNSHEFHKCLLTLKYESFLKVFKF